MEVNAVVGMSARKRVSAEKHRDTLTSMANLTATYRNQAMEQEAHAICRPFGNCLIPVCEEVELCCQRTRMVPAGHCLPCLYISHITMSRLRRLSRPCSTHFSSLKGPSAVPVQIDRWKSMQY